MKHLFISFCAAFLLTACAKTVPAPEALLPVPSERQLAWHEREQYAFVHFTTNTFTDKEWGYGDESPAIFNPTDLDVDQWARVIKAAGLKGIILTCKHHDGFCLWPSAYTEHSVKNSPWRGGKGDLVREVSDACRKHGLFFGVYLSPWDRNRADYGTPAYLTYYRNQLTELLTNYGPVAEVWFDGANGGDGYYGGAREMRKIDNRTYYDWPTTHALVRKLAPAAAMFSDAGPDCRWCGNEAGWAGETDWATISLDTLHPGKAGISPLLSSGAEGGKDWCPAEVDVSIRPGWFYHASEDGRVKQPDVLLKMYIESVGRNANFLLNIPPDRRGQIHENDVKALQGWKKLMDETFAIDLAQTAKVTADTWRGKAGQFAAAMATDEKKDTYWATDDGVTAGALELAWDRLQHPKYLLLQEYIPLGQRVKSFEVDAWKAGAWQTVAKATTIGYKRIIPLTDLETNKLRVRITDARACPTLSTVAVY